MHFNIFKCPKCGKTLTGWPPIACKICHLPDITSEQIYVFSTEPNLRIDGDEQYIGFDSLAKTYDETRHLIPNLEHIIAANIINQIENKKTLIDIGAGTGVYTIALAKYIDKVIAADISIEMLKTIIDKMMKTDTTNILPCQINLYRLPINSSSIDIAFAVNIFNLLSCPEKVIYEIKRVLNVNGVLITICYNDISPLKVDINDEIENLYYQEISKREIKILKPAGWKGPQLDTELSKHFRIKEILNSPDLTFKLSLTPKYEFENLRTRAYPQQLLLQQSIHNQIMEVVDTIMIHKYGPSYQQIELQYEMKVEIHIYKNN